MSLLIGLKDLNNSIHHPYSSLTRECPNFPSCSCVYSLVVGLIGTVENNICIMWAHNTSCTIVLDLRVDALYVAVMTFASSVLC